MRKKNLLIQNHSLFAEVERKSTEIDGLNLKVEELNTKAQNLLKAKADLEAKLHQAEEKVAELEKENAELKDSLLQNLTVNATPQPVAEVAPQPVVQTVPEQVEPPAPVVGPAPAPMVSEPAPAVEQPAPVVQPPKPAQPEIKKPAYTPATDELRNYGAEIIGRVTRVTAGVLNKIEQKGGDVAASLNTLALGKNESVKFAVLSLAQSGREPNEVKAEMDRLAEEAIVYLESI